MAAASQEARAGAERRRWFAAASAAVERRQASASRWTRAAPPPLPFPASGGRMKVAGAEVGHTRLSAFRLPDFMRQARSRWMPVPPAPSDGIGSELFVFRGSKTRVRTRRENASSLRAPASNPALCAGLDCFVAEPGIGTATSGRTRWRPRNGGRRCATRGRRFTRSRRRLARRARHRASMASDPRWLDNLSVGAGEGIRTLDPNLGKVVLYP